MSLVDDAFAELLHRIELNPTRVQLASQRYQSVKSVVEAELSGATVRQIGSFQRQTKIRPIDLSDGLDVDALAVLGRFASTAPAGQGMGAATAFEKVLKALRRDSTYSVMDPKPDAPVVTLEYADGFAMEVAVGYVDETGDFPRSKGDGPPCYVVADGKRWKPADYDFDAEQITRLDQLAYVNGALVPSIKILKFLLRKFEAPLKSFHVEILAALVVPQLAKAWTDKGSRWGYQHVMADFLKLAKNHLVGPVVLPGSFSPPVDSGLSVDELGRLGRFFDKAGDLAWKYCGIKDEVEAVEAWQDFFGEPFPPPSAVT